MLKCARCNGVGKVRKHLLGIYTCGCFYMIIFIFISLVFGSIIGIISYILLIKNLLPGYFGIIFYFLGALSFFSIIFHDSIINVLNEKEILFKKIIDRPLLLILIIFLSYINTKLGKYLISSDKIFIHLIYIIYSILQGAFIIFMIIIISHINSLKPQIECPLCEGNKFIEERIFRKMKRCNDCSQDCGYERPNCIEKRGFCKGCKGKGYNIKND